jgi:hypothetical protein
MNRNGPLLLSLVLLFPLSVFARAKNSHSLYIADAVIVSGHKLAPGHYKVEWQHPGQHVKVNFLQDGKVIASAPATVKANDAQVTQDDIVTAKTTSNKTALTEIDFAQKKEAITFTRPSRG